VKALIDWKHRPTRHHVWLEPVPQSDAQRGGWARPGAIGYETPRGGHLIIPRGWEGRLYTVHRPTLLDLITSPFEKHEHVYYEADMTTGTCIEAPCRSCGHVAYYRDMIHAMANGRVIRPDLQTELPLWK
jgi:hypothetical protein